MNLVVRSGFGSERRSRFMWYDDLEAFREGLDVE